MASYFLFLMILLVSPVLVLLIHVVCVRVFRKIKPDFSPLPVAATAVLCGYPLMGLVLWGCHLRFLRGGEWFLPVVFALIVYSCLSFCYFILFTMSETARRIHILRVLQEKGVVPVSALAGEYNATDMLSVRLERMAALKQLQCVQGRYYLQAKLLWGIGRLVLLWAAVLGFSKKA